MSGPPPYLNSKISLVSKAGIRYEGILYAIDTKESTVALSKVRLFGTENRVVERIVSPRDEIYEYIIFRGSDIHDLQVCEPPQSEQSQIIDQDPAIVTISKNLPKFDSNISSFGHNSNGGTVAPTANITHSPVNATTNSGHNSRPRVPQTLSLSNAHHHSNSIHNGGGVISSGKVFHNSNSFSSNRNTGPPTPLILPNELSSRHHSNNKDTTPYSAPYRLNNPATSATPIGQMRSATFNNGRYNNSGNYYWTKSQPHSPGYFGISAAGYNNYNGRDFNYPDYNSGATGYAKYRTNYPQHHVDHSGDPAAFNDNRYSTNKNSRLVHNANFGKKSAFEGGIPNGAHNNGITNFHSYNSQSTGDHKLAPGPRHTGRAPLPNNARTNRKLFKEDYDFDSANAVIAVEFSKMFLDNKNTSQDEVEIKSENEADEKEKIGVSVEAESEESHSDKAFQAPFYNKQKSFFDFIGSESVDRANGVKVNQLNRRDEKLLNEETFGDVNARRSFKYRSSSTSGYQNYSTGYRNNNYRYDNNNWRYKQYT